MLALVLRETEEFARADFSSVVIAVTGCGALDARVLGTIAQDLSERQVLDG